MFVYHVHRDTFYYVMLVQTRTFDSYGCHDIMWAFLFLWRLMTCNVLCPAKSDLEGTYSSTPGGTIEHTWAVYGKVSCIQLCRELERT